MAIKSSTSRRAETATSKAAQVARRHASPPKRRETPIHHQESNHPATKSTSWMPRKHHPHRSSRAIHGRTTPRSSTKDAGRQLRSARTDRSATEWKSHASRRGTMKSRGDGLVWAMPVTSKELHRPSHVTPGEAEHQGLKQAAASSGRLLFEKHPENTTKSPASRFPRYEALGLYRHHTSVASSTRETGSRETPDRLRSRRNAPRVSDE